MYNLLRTIVRFLFPQNCFSCGAFDTVFCGECVRKLTLLDSGYCLVCGKKAIKGFTHPSCINLHSPERLISFFSYEGVLRDCILDSKYKSKAFCIFEEASELAVHMLAELDIFFTEEVILVPVPMSKDKFSERTFNQTEIIAETLKRKFNCRIENVLEKKKDFNFQHSLNRKERAKNVRNSFLVRNPQKIKGKDVVLIDDVCTTGATFLECAKELKKAKVRFIYCLSLAYTTLSSP